MRFVAGEVAHYKVHASTARAASTCRSSACTRRQADISGGPPADIVSALADAPTGLHGTIASGASR